MTTSPARTPKHPPPWFVHTAWRVHRALYRLGGGRFLWTTSNKRGPGFDAPHDRRAEVRTGAQRHSRLPRGRSRSRRARDERVGRGAPRVVAQPRGGSGRRRSAEGQEVTLGALTAFDGGGA